VRTVYSVGEALRLREEPWQAEARWHPNGLPANMAAVLHDQWKRNQRRVVIGPYGWELSA
jgi:hypothetical protein